MSNVTHITPKQASLFFNVTETTLRDWADKGKINCTKTKGGHRRYEVNQDQYQAHKQKNTTQKTYFNPYAKVIYARVSSRKQETHLKNQVSALQKKYPGYKVITDIGSGLNYERPGLKTILEQLFKGNIEQVVVAHKDRLVRFGFDFLKWIFEFHGAQLLVLYEQQDSDLNPEVEMAEDILSIITVFSAKYHGSRSYNSILPKNTNLSQSSTKTTIS